MCVMEPTVQSTIAPHPDDPAAAPKPAEQEPSTPAPKPAPPVIERQPAFADFVYPPLPPLPEFEPLEPAQPSTLEWCSITELSYALFGAFALGALMSGALAWSFSKRQATCPS